MKIGVVDQASRLLDGAARLGHGVARVDGQGMVDGGHEGRAGVLHQEEAQAQALVVVDDVEAPLARQVQELGRRPQAEGEHEREEADAGGGELEQVQGVEELPGVGPKEEIAPVLHVVEPAEAFQAVDLDPRRHGGVGRPRDDVHLVAQAGELSGQVKEVDTLPAGIHAAVVHEEADPHAALPLFVATERSSAAGGEVGHRSPLSG